MNYDHVFHAGSFTDVYKHLVLMCLFEKMKIKETAFCYFDTHSAYPYSDLNSVKAQRSQEAQTGIKKLWQAKKISPLIRTYLNFIDQFNDSLQAKRRYYPGSSALAAFLKRPQDVLMLNELEDDPYQALKSFFRRDKQIHCHQQDASQILKALLPPKEKRGLIFIDPPYEDVNEFDLLAIHLPEAVKRWPTGVFVLWYPVKAMRRIELFLARLKKSIDRPQANFMCCPLANDVDQRLSGSGMFIINPPWQVEQMINPLIKELNAIFV